MLPARKLVQKAAHLSLGTTRRLHSIHSTPWIFTNPEKPQPPQTAVNTNCTRSVCQTRKQRHQQKSEQSQTNDESSTSTSMKDKKGEEKTKSTAPSRPPDRWLYKHMLATSRRWWTDLLDRAFVSPAKPSDDGRTQAQSLDHAKKVATADLDEMQKKLSGIIQIIRTKSEPALVASRRALDSLRGNAIKVILKLEQTAPGQKMSVPVRQFMQESCEATFARAKYVEQIQSMKKDGGCDGASVKPDPNDCCDPCASPPPKGSCNA